MIDDEVRRFIDDLLKGRTAVAGTVTLETSGTTTTVTRQGVSSNSIVSLTPQSSAAASSGIPEVTPAKGLFTLTHSIDASSRIYGYVIHTPQS